MSASQLIVHFDRKNDEKQSEIFQILDVNDPIFESEWFSEQFEKVYSVHVLALANNEEFTVSEQKPSYKLFGISYSAFTPINTYTCLLRTKRP